MSTLFIVSAPSGAGKTSLVSALTESLGNLNVSVSHTTRAQRPGETDGVDYHFVSKDQFAEQLHHGDFLEHAEVFGNFYGTSQQWVEQHLSKDEDVILEIDWQGAKQIRQTMPDSVSIFILPPSRKSLEARLQSRAQDSEDVIKKRLSEAKNEMTHYVEFDYIVVNDDFDHALNELKAIVQAERLSTRAQAPRLSSLISDLLS